MKLLELRLKNFKGIKELELKANGGNLQIFGNNGTGKTTIFDAFTWLLFDTDSKNKTEFGIKTWDPDGNVIHHLDHEVEGKFSIDDEVVELKKVYREKWVKRRGATERTFDGHETDHFVDGVPVTKTEYNAKTAEIAPEKQFRLLTSPTYFNDVLHWEDRRKILLDVCGDVLDGDVIKFNDKLTKLPDILGKHSLDDYKKIIASRRAEINKELDRVPIRIDEVHQGLPDISAIENPDAIESDLEKLAKAKTEKEAELAALLSGSNQGEIKQKIAELEAELLSIETAYKREHAKKVGEIEDKIKGCQDVIRDVQYQISTKETALESSRKSVGILEKSIVDLRDKWHEVNARESLSKAEEVCPTCKQTLPADKVQETNERLLAEFNTAKAKTLADINSAGKSAKQELEKVTAKIADLEKEISEHESSLERLAEDNAGLQAELTKVNARFEDYKEQDDFKKLVTQKDKLQKQLDGQQVDLEPEKERIESEIQDIEQAADAIRTAKANLEAHDKAKKRIVELENEQRKLSDEFEELEFQLHLIEEFIRNKVSLLTDKINSKFKIARFKLFEEQVNGAIKEICETTLNGVPWSDLNTGGTFNVGLDIINTLSEHYGFAPPIFVDNAEAVTKLIEVDAQLISLIVSAEDRALRVEGTGDTKPSLMHQVGLFEEAV